MYRIGRVMRESNGVDTVGITLRLDKRVLEMYAKIAFRANEIRIKNGNRGDVTAQDIIRHRLSSLPILKAGRGKKGAA